MPSAFSFLRAPWLGPRRVEEAPSPIAHIVRPEVGSMAAREHASRLAPVDEPAREPLGPREGAPPGSRRLMQLLQGKREAADALPSLLKLKPRRRAALSLSWSPLEVAITAGPPASRDLGARAKACRAGSTAGRKASAPPFAGPSAVYDGNALMITPQYA